MNVREAIKVISDNLNLTTEFAANVAVNLKNANNQKLHLNQKNCSQLAQAFMVLSANIKNPETH